MKPAKRAGMYENGGNVRARMKPAKRAGTYETGETCGYV